MSVDSKELDRSALESKDRDELVTIATALGTKPPSRARKGEVVDLILELTGAVSPGASKGATAGRTAAAADSSEADGSSGSDAAASAGGDESPRPSGRGRGRGGAASRSTADAEDEPKGDAQGEPTGDVEAAADGSAGGERTGSGGDRQGGERERPGGGDRQGGERNRQGNRQGGERSRQGGGQGDRQGGGQGDRQGGGQGGGQQSRQPLDDGEPGNKRRRRRGRGRDRDAPGFVEPGSSEPDEPWNGEPVEVEGYLDLRDDGYGFLRVKGFLSSKDDPYISVKQARQLGLRRGDHVKGASRPAARNEKNPAMLRIDEVNGKDPELAKRRPRFEDLTPLFPDEKLSLEQANEPLDMTARIVDLVAPVGKGQRGLIVSPPKAGKTTVMKTIAKSIEANNPEVHLIVLLVDERPEEVTDMRRSVRGDVVASTFDRPSDEHTAVSEMTIERAKRMVEDGRDVVIILDGITRLARAYNLAAPATGRIMSGGIDTGALYPPKRFFGAARNIEEGGSLTILATALVETGSKMDEVIFEEFKGTGNMELRLDRRLAERRIYPAIDVDASSTRHEELLFDRKQLQMVWKLRRVLSGLAAEGSSGAGLEMLIDRLATFKTNDDFLSEIAKSPGMNG